jgi:pyridinium-3,5-bisthiocarboxylic acid mononucleotide nickel chelatase
VKRSALSPAGQDRAMHMFERLAAAEAAIHDMPIERVHLHEVGAIDSIIDIVGAVHGFEWAGADQVLSSALNVGGGTVRCAHGTFPVPAPATARLLEGVPVYSGAVAMELVTPTGALIVTEYAAGYQALPAMTVRATGYGAGTRDVPGHPNVLRMWLGETEFAERGRVGRCGSSARSTT